MSREPHATKVEKWIGIDQLPEQALLYPGSFNPFIGGIKDYSMPRSKLVVEWVP